MCVILHFEPISVGAQKPRDQAAAVLNSAFLGSERHGLYHQYDTHTHKMCADQGFTFSEVPSSFGHQFQ